MNRKTIISLIAAATLSIGFASAAKADPVLDFGVHFGSGAPTFDLGVSDGGYYPDYYDAGYDDSSDCGWQWVSHSHWNHSHTYKIITTNKVWVCE